MSNRMEQINQVPVYQRRWNLVNMNRHNWIKEWKNQIKVTKDKWEYDDELFYEIAPHLNSLSVTPQNPVPLTGWESAQNLISDS